MVLLACALAVLLLYGYGVQSLSYNPDNYLEVYPDPRNPDVLQGRTPLHFGLIQSLGGPLSQFDAAGSVAGVKVALDDINNDSSLLPGYTLHYTFADSQCNRKISLNVLHSQLFHEPTKLAIIGSGCSLATEPAGEVSHYYNITQMSCVSSSPELSNRTRFPRYFQLLSSSERRALGYYGVIKEYGWRRVALIIQDENIFQVTMARLKEFLEADGIEYTERKFTTNAGIASLGPNPFDENARIFVFSMYRIHALPLVCEAYHRGFLLPRYLLLTIGWYVKFWWREEQPGLSCTVEQRESVLLSSIAVSDEVFLDEEEDANITTTSGITVGEFIDREKDYIGQPPLNVEASQYSSYCHDATWALAYALNNTLNSLSDASINEELAQVANITPPFRLEDFTYNNDKMLELVFKHLHNTSLNGITGQVTFGENGIRDITNLIIFQYRKVSESLLKRQRIGYVLSNTSGVSYVQGENEQTVWRGLIPYDGVPENRTVAVHVAVTSVIMAFASAGITFSVVCLVFNFVCRHKKLVKLASTKLNYLIGVGAIILYLNTFFFVTPSTHPRVVSIFCNLTSWLTAIGYSLCYGTILAKMARVYYIFNNPSPKKKTIKDRFLMLGVAFLVAIDLTILAAYSFVEGSKGNLDTTRLVRNRENPSDTSGPLDIVTHNFIYICDSTARDVFLGVLYGYKMLLQVIALLLAFSIRKVKVKGLDDAKYIAAAIYVTSIVLAMIIVATYSLKDVINGFVALFCTGFLVGTTVILILVFVPLMVGVYKDPEGNNIFKQSANGVSESLHNICTKIEATKTELKSDNEVHLQQRIKKLEEEVKEKNDLISSMLKDSILESNPELKERTTGENNIRSAAINVESEF